MIAEFGRVTNVAANNFFVKLDDLTPALLAFFEDNSATKAEVDAFNQKVGIIVVIKQLPVSIVSVTFCYLIFYITVFL